MVDEKEIIIYKYVNKLNGKTYIGQTQDLDIRHKQHLQLSNNNPIMYIDRAIAKYGIDNFIMTIIDNVNENVADQAEENYIRETNSLVPNGYNIRPGGKTSRGFNFSDEHKQKLSETHKGLPSPMKEKKTY